MANEIQIEVEGLEQLYKKLGLNILPILEPPIDRSGHRVEGKMKVYPEPPPPGLWAATTSPKQKAAFFAKLRSGEYTGRTGQYGAGWMTTTQLGDAVVTSEIGNPTPYAGWVSSQEMQARFHRGRWPADVTVLEEESPRLLEDTAQAGSGAYESA